MTTCPALSSVERRTRVLALRTYAHCVVCTGLLSLAVCGACSRAHYRFHADRETYGILSQKLAGAPWSPGRFSIGVDPRSRLFDPTPPDAPILPSPQPRLYDYDLPPLISEPVPAVEELPRPEVEVEGLPAPSPRDGMAPTTAPGELPTPSASDDLGPIQPTSFQVESPARPASPTPSGEGMTGLTDGPAELPLVPIPIEAWQSLPRECLARMLAFERVRGEYLHSFGAEPPAGALDRSRELTLNELIELGFLNSREYQLQKEQLYRAALALSLRRFDYALKFSTFGNGVDLDYRHDRTLGSTVNGLGIPTSVQADKFLATGGTFLARFANDVLLTFNGPDGFTADIGSELFFNLSQSIFQRDVLFEPLTRAEREVVYAARDYARFRKTLFFDLANDYYAITRIYRQIEIEAQNYFSLVRAFSQAQAELRAGLRSRVQVEQIEQSMLQGRSQLLAICVSLERGLDRFKIRMGVPPETRLALNLGELLDLTLRDEAAVAGELVRRSRDRLRVQQSAEFENRVDLIHASVLLGQRTAEWLALAGPSDEAREVAGLVARLRLDEARAEVDRNQRALAAARQEAEASPIRVFERIMDLVDARLAVALRAADLVRTTGTSTSESEAAAQQAEMLATERRELADELNRILDDARLADLPQLVQSAANLLERAAGVADMAEQAAPVPAAGDEAAEMARIRDSAGRLLEVAQSRLGGARLGLAAVEIPLDDAMLTALSLRLDLMNERGSVADARRGVKIAADELRSVLNLNATQVIRTRKNRPFEFSEDESFTNLGLSLDLPFNRQAQRNLYRFSLIDYQVALRSLMVFEDGIKLAVRDDLRDLGNAENQYHISVASAALAAERVTSTRLELALGFPGVAARDFLEAQDAYRSALGAVADNHTQHIVTRMRLFLDMELMELDELGVWPGLGDESLQPIPRFEPPPGSGPPYGQLPRRIHYSREIRGLHPN